MLNSDLVESGSANLASNLLASNASSDADRISRLYLQVFGRKPVPGEAARAEAFLERFAQGVAGSVPEARERDLRAWRGACAKRCWPPTNLFILTNEGLTVDQFNWELTSRRRMLKGWSTGLGPSPWPRLVAEESPAAALIKKSEGPPEPHFPARAKRVIFPLHEGGRRTSTRSAPSPCFSATTARIFPSPSPVSSSRPTGKLLASAQEVPQVR